VKRYYPSIRFYAFSILPVVNFPFLFYPAAALKTQPYDLLRWSAAYFRCLSMDVLPPVKPRYEHENVFGCLTKGYLKVLLSQVRGVTKGKEVWGGRHIPVIFCFTFSMSLYRILVAFARARTKLWFVSFPWHTNQSETFQEADWQLTCQLAFKGSSGSLQNLVSFVCWQSFWAQICIWGLQLLLHHVAVSIVEKLSR
jgi:hypothetical protein